MTNLIEMTQLSLLTIFLDIDGTDSENVAG